MKTPPTGTPSGPRPGLPGPAGALVAGAPARAWAALETGNSRFVAGRAEHPGQDAGRRVSLAQGQQPFALVFGCADSRVGPEIVFDRGLGDLFVVRTAGHVVDSGVLGSIEYGVGVLGIPLVVILGHDRCGAVAAAIDSVDSGLLPGGFVRDVVERVTPSVLTARRAGMDSVAGIEAEHVRHTGRLLVERSALLADRVATRQVCVVGATYSLREGRVRLVDGVGELDGLVPSVDDPVPSVDDPVPSVAAPA